MAAALVLVCSAWSAGPDRALRAVASAQNPTVSSAGSRASAPDTSAVINKYCTSCHSERLRTAGVVLQGVDAENPGANAELWERVAAKLRAGSMPPAGSPRPDPATYEAIASRLEAALDRAWAAHPNPGRINAVHRLNRTEYKNAIRDLFALDVDVATLLPGDETADGSFDNFADVLTISTAHLERYLSVARQVTRQAIGLPPASAGLQRFEIPLHVVQDDRQSEDLPFGSRGGMAFRYHFPVNGEYLIKIRLRHATTGRPLKYSSLVNTLCHELAHLRHFDHGLRFRAFYQELLAFARAEGIYRPGDALLRTPVPVVVAGRERAQREPQPGPRQLSLFGTGGG